MLQTITRDDFFGGPPPEPTDEQAILCQWTPWRDVRALIRLCEIHQPKRFLEVGCHVGLTTMILSGALPDMAITAIDPGQLIPMADRSPAQCGEYEPPKRVGDLVRGSRNVTVKTCTINELPESDRYDAVFIDGDHRFASVLNDTRQAFARLNPGGLIIWHDVGNAIVPDVLAALESLAIEITWIAGTWTAFHSSRQ